MYSGRAVCGFKSFKLNEMNTVVLLKLVPIGSRMGSSSVDIVIKGALTNSRRCPEEIVDLFSSSHDLEDLE
jgi:hypothetical protein